MNYQIQGLSIHAEVHGTAEPALVFLHYWGGTSRTWRKVTAELEGQFKTVAYDARGWGMSEKTLAGYKLADLADEALSLVKALGIKQYVMVGHSMGGTSLGTTPGDRRPRAEYNPRPAHEPRGSSLSSFRVRGRDQGTSTGNPASSTSSTRLRMARRVSRTMMLHPTIRLPTPTMAESSPKISRQLKTRRRLGVVNEDPTSEISVAAANDPIDM